MVEGEAEPEVFSVWVLGRGRVLSYQVYECMRARKVSVSL
jgi:hypothetical protein